jgi:polyribonucleotide nucleotidyltransferase
MDNKAKGLSVDILRKALLQAKEGRAHILGKMYEAIAEPRADLSEFAPRVITIKIPTDKIRDIIGPGGKMIRSIIEATGADIDVNDDGTIYIASRDQGGEEAVRRIQMIIKEPEIGEKYTGRVVTIQPFGAFIELFPGKDGLLHISRVAKGRVDRVEDVLNVGDQVEVEIIDIDDRGKVSLDSVNKPDAPPSSGAPRPEGDRGPRPGGDRGPRPGDRSGGGGGPRRRH